MITIGRRVIYFIFVLIFSIHSILVSKCDLRIRHAQQENQAFQMKLGWGTIKHLDEPQVHLIRSKYKCDSDILSTINKKRLGSNIWFGIKVTWGFFQTRTVISEDQQDASWKWSKSGQFSVKHTYKIVAQHTTDYDSTRKQIWKLQVLEHCKFFFLWLSYHNKLLTNIGQMHWNACGCPV